MDLNRIQKIISNKDKQEPVPKKPNTSAIPSDIQKTVGSRIAAMAMQNIKSNTPYQLAESGLKRGIDPSLTCIGGVCDLYKNLGVDFSGLGGEISGVRESRTGGKVVEYNPTFEKNYKKAGFERIKDRPINAKELHDLIVNKELSEGDIIQFYDDKGKPVHSNIIVSKDEDGGYSMYNAYKHSNYNTLKEPFIEKTNPEEYERNPEAFKNKKFNVFRLGEETAKKISNVKD